MPKRSDPDDFFAQLEAHQRPHLEQLRDMSRRIAPDAEEVLKWNLPTYVLEDNTDLWMPQAFKHHCSLRFTPEFLAEHRTRITEAGEECGAGLVKLPYHRNIPVEPLEQLMQERLRSLGAGGGSQSGD